MAESAIYLEVVTPEKMVFSGMIESIIVPAALGYLGVLKNHAPLVTALQIGVITFRYDGKPHRMAISGGFMEVMQNKVVILADTAEMGEQIDLQRATEAKERAARRLQEKTPDLDVLRAEMALRRAVSRIKAAR